MVGRPMEVPRVAEPTPELVAEYLDKYCKEVEALFHRWVRLGWFCLVLVWCQGRVWGLCRSGVALSLTCQPLTSICLHPSLLSLCRHKHKYGKPGETIEIS